MTNLIELQINEHEEQLRQAMLQSDLTSLDKLLSAELIFTNHLGQLMTKQNDLELHKSEILKINKIVLSDQKIKIYGAIAIVVVQAYIRGRFDGTESENSFRFTRIWNKTSNETWQIVAGHSTIVV